jgi:hypothetical protein
MKSCGIGGDKPGPDQLERIEKILSKIPEDNVLFENTDYIKALGDPTRLKIIYLLTMVNCVFVKSSLPWKNHNQRYHTI